jgi:hypothetical protein
LGPRRAARAPGYRRYVEKATPSFVARAWLDRGFAGEHAFRGRTTERHHLVIGHGRWISLRATPELTR